MMSLVRSNSFFTSALGQLLCLYLLAIAVQMFARLVASLVSQNALVVNLFENTAALFLVIWLISYYRLWPEIGWLSFTRIKTFPVFLIPSFYILLNLGEIYEHPLLAVVSAGINALISASFEELLCRILALHILINGFVSQGKTRPILYAVLVSSLLFGLAHLANLLNRPEALGALLGQTLYASFIGVGFAACYLITRSLVPLILIHAAINFMSFMGESGMEPDALTFEDTLGTVIVCLPLLIFGIWLLRKEPSLYGSKVITRKILNTDR